MPRPLEVRRRAIADALRSLAREPRRTSGVVAAQPTSPAQPAQPAPAAGSADAVVDAVEARLDALSAKISEVLSRLDSVETTLLEAAWERPSAAQQAHEAEQAPAGGDDDAPDDDRVSVPRVPLGEGRMSSAAARALFGG